MDRNKLQNILSKYDNSVESILYKIVSKMIDIGSSILDNSDSLDFQMYYKEMNLIYKSQVLDYSSDTKLLFFRKEGDLYDVIDDLFGCISTLLETNRLGRLECSKIITIKNIDLYHIDNLFCSYCVNQLLCQNDKLHRLCGNMFDTSTYTHILNMLEQNGLNHIKDILPLDNNSDLLLSLRYCKYGVEIDF